MKTQHPDVVRHENTVYMSHFFMPGETVYPSTLTASFMERANGGFTVWVLVQHPGDKQPQVIAAVHSWTDSVSETFSNVPRAAVRDLDDWCLDYQANR